MILPLLSGTVLLAMISIISPELFKVIIPPELLGVLKKVALLPKDLARIVDGLVHIPVDTMKAIVVLDAPASTKGLTDPVHVCHL